MGKIIGIDLGTSTSCVSFFENGQTTVIANAEGQRTTPSVVSFSKTGERLVGAQAVRQSVTNPKKTIHSVKRFIGHKFNEIKDVAKLMAYDVIAKDNNDTAIKIDDKLYSPEEISSMTLSKLKRDAEAYLGETITQAVITVPAYFNDAQRQATKDAGKIAGLEVLRIINEPTAAALAYGIDKTDTDKTIVVFDLGGGTADCSILECGDGVFEVLATNGDSLLGGKDFDEAIVKYITTKFKDETGIDISNDAQALQRLTEAAEKAKCELSTAQFSDINLPFISMNADGPVHLNETITRAKFEELISDILNRFKDKCETCLKDSGKSLSDIDEILMVGGSTRIPFVQEFAKNIFGKEVNKSINPDEAVSCGAAIQASILNGDTSMGDIVLLDVTSISYGIEVEGGIFAKLIDANTTIPTKKTEIFSTASDNQPVVVLRILQGESKLASRNKLIGEFNLDGILPAPRGVPQIEVSFNIDANGILTVSALDKGTGKSQNVTIQSNGGLTNEEVEALKKEAELHAEEDNKAAELVEAKNKAESMIYNIEKQIKEYENKISEDTKKLVQEKIAHIKSVKDCNEIETINLAIKDAENAFMKIGEEIYKIQTESMESNSQSESTNSDAVDAEIVE